ncbi:hypothetical protein CERSUDRAFT_112983 [Gelatoporia subvermispora B]|uniref:Peregrin n=1 Tax=Ceriporiopsis subvermispora (strain B) TaxID=914234 RepID=M2QQI4_CERS8|nr:hypothetical protein CERSUDRAFT_112983 [Gelatoporia subvermispora B]
MARGAASPAPAPLPKVSFVKVHDDTSMHPTGVHDLQARSYGYNAFSDFRRPEHYIRYIEPLESELAVQVEYDMDEQDQIWLDAYNEERKEKQLDRVSYEVLEIVMDRLEKEWFNLTKNIPKPDMALPSEDSTCAICDDSEGENTNAIVFCDGCNLAVHQDCYGVPYIPEGQWLCRKCTVSPENPVSCILCPNEGGAFKQTVHGDWVHLLCAIWVPETRVANDVFMEPITGVDKIPKQRWKLKCSRCDVKEGACIQCTKASCFTAFHVTCARKEKLLMPMKASQGSEAPMLTCYCERHLPKEQQEIRQKALASEQPDGENSDNQLSDTKSSKTARAYAKTYKPGPPLVPHIIVERIMQYIGKVTVRQKREFVLLVCKYWSLKREARRGAPLLKRLHLEPWTASVSTQQQTDEDKAIKLEFMKRLRQDLETVRLLTDLSRRREARKRDQAEAIQDVFSHFLFSHEAPLRMAFERITGLDRQDYFRNPVSKVDVPDYYDIIRHPMCWSVIDRKLDNHEYLDLQELKDDILLVVDNAVTYNQPGTPFYRAAQRIKTAAEPILADLDRLVPSPQDHSVPEHSVGDLEPPVHLLSLLLSEDAIKDDINLILDAVPLDSLCSYELPRLKPPPPPKPKRNRKADIERKRLEREAERQALLDASPGFRAVRHTRRAVAAAAAGTSGQEQPAEENATPAVGEPKAEVAESGGIAVVTSPATAKRKHRVTIASSRPDIPPMVEEVDNQQSFKMFDQGWILPPDQRRGGRAPIERTPLPPPKKKQRTDRRKPLSALDLTSATEEGASQQQETPVLGAEDTSIVSGEPEQAADESMIMEVQESALLRSGQPEPVQGTAASIEVVETMSQQDGLRNLETLAKAAQELVRSDDSAEVKQALDEMSDAEALAKTTAEQEQQAEPPAVEELARAEPQTEPPQPTAEEVEAKEETRGRRARKEPPKIIWIEELDTPAIRREKNLRRKQERQRLREEEEARRAAEEAALTGAQGASSGSEAPGESSGRLLKYAEEIAVHIPERAGSFSDLTSLSELSEASTSERALSDIGESEIDPKEDDDVPMDERVPARAYPAESEDLEPEQHSMNPEVEMLDLDDLSEAGSLRERKDEGDASMQAIVPPEPPVHQRRRKSSAPLSPLQTRHQSHAPLAPEDERGVIKLREGETLEPGTLVWAKADTYPWWPAVIYEPPDDDIPVKVLKGKEQVRRTTGGPLHLVRFWDKHRTWQWLELDRLLYLGEDNELDSEMLTPSKRQRFKTPALRQECRKAWRSAMSEKETDGDGEEETAPPVAT